MTETQPKGKRDPHAAVVEQYADTKDPFVN